MLHYDAEGGRATITIDDPERMNPLANETMVELVAAVHRATRDSEVRVVVITGAGDRAFSAGGDLSGGFVDAPIVGHAARGALADLFRALRRCGKPTVARVNGHALGGGFGLAAACDITIAVDTATLGTPEINVGLWPMMISAVLMPLVSRKALLEMMLTGRRIRADEAEELGIVNRVVPAAGLDAAVDEVVDALLAQSPAALALGKEAFYAIVDLDFDTALDHLHNGLTAIAMTEDAVEGVTAFVEKRTPHWHGR
jgi:enoyl-CoA hydratase/carnithine racemase